MTPRKYHAGWTCPACDAFTPAGHEHKCPSTKTVWTVRFGGDWPPRKEAAVPAPNTTTP